MRNKLVIFDVCNTVVDVDSTRFYVDFLKDNGYGKRRLLSLIKNRLFFFLSTIINKVFWYNIHRKLTFWFFKWIDSNQLKRLNKLFLDKYLIKAKLPLKQLIEHRNLGEKVVLISASINPPIEILWEHLWVDTYSSKLIVKNGRYTGKIEYDLLGKKENVLGKWNIDINWFSEIIFYTDNFDDWWLIKYIRDNFQTYKVFLVINNVKTVTKRKAFLHDNKILNYEFIY